MSEGRDAPQKRADEGDASKACRELDRLQKLLEDAVPTLMHSFEKIAELTAAQSALLEESLGATGQEQSAQGGEAVRADRLRLARTYDAHIQHHVNAAVTSLQFEDMAIQLTSHVRERVRRLDREGRTAEERSEEWTRRTFGPISADGLSSGSVDLF